MPKDIKSCTPASVGVFFGLFYRRGCFKIRFRLQPFPKFETLEKVIQSCLLFLPRKLTGLE